MQHELTADQVDRLCDLSAPCDKALRQSAHPDKVQAIRGKLAWRVLPDAQPTVIRPALPSDKSISIAPIRGRSRHPIKARQYRQGTRLTSPAVNTGKFATTFRPVMVWHEDTIAVDTADVQADYPTGDSLARGMQHEALQAQAGAKVAVEWHNPLARPFVGSDDYRRVEHVEPVDYSLHGTGRMNTRRGIKPLGKNGPVAQPLKATDTDSFFE